MRYVGTAVNGAMISIQFGQVHACKLTEKQTGTHKYDWIDIYVCKILPNLSMNAFSILHLAQYVLDVAKSSGIDDAINFRVMTKSALRRDKTVKLWTYI